MNYRLLALTIDEALLRSNFRLSKQTKTAIEFAKMKGIYITLVTDRPFPSAKKVAKALKLNEHLITSDGAFIAADMEEPLYAKRIQEDRAFHIAEILENYYCHFRLMDDHYAIGNKIQQKNQLIAKMSIAISDPLFYPVNFVDSVSSYLLERPVAPAMIQIQFFDEEERSLAMKELEQSVSNIKLSKGKNYRLDVVSQGVSRAKGLQLLGNKIGISLEEMVAVGSCEQDIDMITQVGLGVAMGNSPTSVKSAASWITRSNDLHGVAYMVKEVFRKQQKIKIGKTE